ncbi:putative GNAT domain, acyl-CoA N-acyltransferase [Plasmopara halstedii]
MACIDTLQDVIPRVVALKFDRDMEDSADTKKQTAYVSPERVIYFRNLASSDIPQVRALHEDWFPIRYNQTFYDGAAQGLWMETGGPLFARLAVESQTLLKLQAPFQSSPDHRRDEHIYGAVTASTLPLSKIDDSDLISSDDWEHTHVMYILTLGTQASVRRMGIASALLQECITQACRQPQCGAVYLHVKADNLSARQFYEKNGFQNLRYLQDYYMIDGVRHDAFLYIRYVNGAVPQGGWFDLITRPLFALFSIATLGWKKLLEGFAMGEFDDTSEKHAQTESTSLVLV